MNTLSFSPNNSFYCQLYSLVLLVQNTCGLLLRTVINIQQDSMQYLVQALSDSQPQLKNKLSKMRHLDNLFFNFLIVALVFFLIFQNHQLREELINNKAESMLDDLLQERFLQLQKQVQEMRNNLNEENAKILHKLSENKDLILFVGRELGLPLHESERPKQPQEQRREEQQRRERSEIQVIEMLPSSQQESQSYDETERDIEQSDYEENVPQEQIIKTEENTESTFEFITYLENWEDGNQLEENFVNSRERQYRINTSNFVKIAGYDVDENHVEELKKWVHYIAKATLVLLLIVVLFLITFKRKSKGKQAKPSIRSIWKNMCPEDKKKGILKEEKQPLKL